MARKSASRIVYGASPRVDLLPEAQRAERRHRQTLPRLLLAIVASAAVAALLWFSGLAQVMLASQRLVAATAEEADLTAQLAQFAEEQTLIGSVDTLTHERRTLSASEVLFIDVFDEIDGRLPGGVALIRFTGALAGEGAASSAGELAGLDLNPLCVPDVASVTATFNGPDLAQAPAFLRDLEQLTGFKCIVATKIAASEERGGQDITVQIALTDEALAQRFEEAGE